MMNTTLKYEDYEDYEDNENNVDGILTKDGKTFNCTFVNDKKNEEFCISNFKNDEIENLIYIDKHKKIYFKKHRR